jgi:thymidylate synthase (FAD)
MADDLSVVNSARVSFGKRSETLEESDEKLIEFLLRERHGTPFEHNAMRFHIKVPLFVAREWFRHRIGWSYNELSARYTKIENSHWVPEVKDVRSQVGKPGNYTFEPVEADIASEAARVIGYQSDSAWRTYNYLIEIGVAKEQARAVLPVGTMTEFYATCNARSLMHFISLRASTYAQMEIQRPAREMENIFSQLMPVTHKAFNSHGRVAP